MTHPTPASYSFLVVMILISLLIFWISKKWLHIRIQAPDRFSRLQVDALVYPFKAGDIILSPSGWITRMFVGSFWGHVAVIYKDPQCEMLYAWETRIPVQGTWTTLTTSLKSKATRLTPLFRYIERSPKPVCVRPINREVDILKFQEFIKKKWDQPFGFDFLTTGANRVFMDLVGVPAIPRSKQSARFCAELVAETLIYLGVFDVHNSVDPHMRTDHIIPRDFSQQDEHLPLATCWSFGDEVLLATT